MITRRKIHHWLCIAVFVLVLLPLHARSNAQDGSFSETFDDPALPGWERSPEAQAIDGALRIQPGGFAAYLGAAWEDLTLTVRARQIGEGGLLVIYRNTDTGGYGVQLEPGVLLLLRREGINGAISELGAAPLAVPLEEWLQIGITVQANTHTILINGQPALTASDPNPLPPGGISLRVIGNATGEFDDLVVSTADETPPGAVSEPSSSVEGFDPATLQLFTAGVSYLGSYETGLYPGASNEMPASHRAAGEEIAATIRPLNTEGQPDDENGRILALAFGHSNAQLYFDALQAEFVEHGAELNPRFEFLNAAVGGEQLPQIATLQGPVWEQAQQLTSQPGYSPLQVQALFLHTTYHGCCNDEGIPPGEFPASMQAMQQDLAKVLTYSLQIYPNLKIAYLTSDGFRYYRGFEPHVWQEAFAFKWLIESQINGEPGTAYTGEGRQLPWLEWGPYIWDNTWDESYFQDGVHPTAETRVMVARQYWDHLSSDSVTRRWLFVSPATSITPSGGPSAYQAGSWVRTGGPIGGLGYDIRYNFADYNLWYVTDAWSGFYISTDNGATWTPSNTGITARKGTDGIPIFSATVDPHDPNIIWIGTDLTGDIFKSTDGGHTWVEMTNGVDPTLRPMSFRGFTVDPRTSDIVYAMAEIGSPAWTPDHNPRKGLEMDLTQGIVYKTIDGGEHWTEIWRGDNLARYAWIDPRDPDVLYVSTGIFDKEAANTNVETGFAGGVGILKSTDGGQTWRILNQDNGLLDLYIGSLYMNPQNPDMLLAAAGQNNWSRYGEQFTGGIYLTEDGGEHWERVIADDEIFSTVEFCVSDPHVAYAGSSRSIYRSDDSGHTWQRFTRADHTWGSPGVVAGFPIDMQCDPVDPMRIFINNYLGGNFLSTDGGQTWVLSSDGYTGELVNVVSAAPGIVYVGSRSGVYRSNNGGEDWIGLVYPPKGMDVKFNEIVALAVDPADTNHVLAVPSDYRGVLYSTDGGQSWQMGSVFGPIQLVFAPSDPSMVYATADTGLFVSGDGGMTWTPLQHEQVSGFSPPVVAVQPNDAHTVYVSRPDTGVLKTTDGGQTWTLLTTGLPQAPVMALAVDPANPQILFAGVGAGQASMGGGGVFRSTDGGLTWAQMSAGLPPEGMFLSVVIDPTNSQVVYVGDNFSGVYVSTDGGTTWNTLNNGLQHREVKVLSISPDGRVLYAGTWGDGVYRLGTP